MRSQITSLGMKSIIMYTNKLARNYLSGLNVDEASILRTKQMIAEKNRVVLLPFYKSYADFFVLSYVLHHY